MPCFYKHLCLLLILLGYSLDVRAINQIQIEKVLILTNRNSHQNLTTRVLFPENNSLFLQASESSILIYFSSGHKSDYEYTLKYFNYDTYRTSDNTILFTNLPSGDYELKIVDRFHKEIRPGYLKISIEAPIWQRWWFLPMMFVYGLFFVAIFLYLFFLYRTRNQLHFQSLKHELEIKALRAQMNPHFIFNSLSTIDSYIARKQWNEASDCLQKFSKLIRQILENSENPTISIEKELATLRLYIELEQARFAGTFAYRIEVDDDLQDASFQIPPLMLQPFAENAILHGLRHLEGRKGLLLIKLQIASRNDKEYLFCQIEDNGIGRKASAELNRQYREAHKSMGMNVTFERIAAHQAHYGAQMKTEIEDLTVPATGTVVRIWLPLLENYPEVKH